MEMWKIILVIAVQPLLCISCEAVVRICIYICQEVKYSVSELKRGYEYFIRDVEWKLKLMKGDKTW